MFTRSFAALRSFPGAIPSFLPSPLFSLSVETKAEAAAPPRGQSQAGSPWGLSALLTGKSQRVTEQSAGHGAVCGVGWREGGGQ